MFNKVSFFAFYILILFICACGTEGNTVVGRATSEQVKPYLLESVPPCLPTELEPDPCPNNSPTPQDSIHSTFASIQAVKITSFTDRLIYDPEDGIDSIHIVVRGTVKTNTTRCRIFRVKLSDHSAQRLQELEVLPVEDQYIIGRYHYTCFADIAVKEYIVGVGPPTLTVILDIIYLKENQLADFDKEEERYFEYYGDPEEVATSYEGREIIFFLGPSPSLAVEAWAGLGGYNMWFLQQTDGEIRALAQNIWRATGIEEIRKTLDRPLDEMVADIKQAAINRETITGGRLGLDPYLPMLITDAHNLRDYYTSVGAVYDDTENATVLPPPVPGEDDPTAPTLPVNDGATGTTILVPGEETTAPPATDSDDDNTTTTVPNAEEQTTTTGAPPPIDGDDPEGETVVPPPADDDIAPPADDGEPEATPAPGGLPADETTS